MGVGSGRGSRARARERRMREKQARKNAKRALYESLRGTARNVKDKTAGGSVAKPKGIIYLTPARKYETMLATKTALPVLEHRQSQSHNLIDRVKEKIKS